MESSTPSTVSVGLRLPILLRDKLQQLAAGHGRSLNSEVTQRLTESLWPSQSRELTELLESLNLPRVHRLTSPTSSEVTRLLHASRHFRAESLLLAARADDLNRAVLVAVIECPYFTLLMDGSSINLARRPRTLDAEQLFQNWDAMGLLDGARYCSELVPDTQHLSAEDALQVIVREGKPTPVELEQFLHLWSRHGIFDISRFRTPAARSEPAA